MSPLPRLPIIASGLPNILLDPGFEGFFGGKFLLGAEESVKLDLHPLAINLAFEIQQVKLQDRPRGFCLRIGRAFSKIHDARKPRAGTTNNGQRTT